jgi:hypothetical protein
MPNAQHTDVFTAKDFRNFFCELNRFEKVRHSRPHYPEPLWHRALCYAGQRHSARALNNYHLALNAQDYRAPTATWHEKLYTESIARMNGKPLRLALLSNSGRSHPCHVGPTTLAATLSALPKHEG